MKAFTKSGTPLALLALIVALGCTLFWFNQARHVSLPDDRTIFVLIWLSAVAMAVTALVRRPGWIGGIAAVPAIVIGLFLPFTVSISEQILPPNAIQVGDTIPRFSAPDDRGEVFDSERLRGNPVLIKFFRAHW